jgi:pimeloyl-ACP methyl ester carboxylesterase
MGRDDVSQRPVSESENDDVVDTVRIVANGVTLGVTRWRASRERYPPVVVLPGTGQTSVHWADVSGQLSVDRDVYDVDLRGHGRSDRPGTYSIALMADDVAALLPQLAGSGSVDLIGHSLGGLVACKAVAGHPLGVRRLVLEDVGLPHPRDTVMPARPPGELDFDWAMVEQIRPEIDTPDPGWPNLLRQIGPPTLVIAGGPSSFVPAAHIRDLVTLVPDAAVMTIDAGHEIHSNRPEQFLSAVRAFLDVED